MNREEEIKMIAYGIWEQDGCQNGKDVLHWVHAELIWESRQKTKAAGTGDGKKAAPKGSK